MPTKAFDGLTAQSDCSNLGMCDEEKRGRGREEDFGGVSICTALEAKAVEAGGALTNQSLLGLGAPP